MRLSNVLASCVALSSLLLGGCAGTRCCPAPSDRATAAAPRLALPEPRDVGVAEAREVFLDAAVLRVPMEVALGEPAAAALAAKGGHVVLPAEDATALRARLIGRRGVETLQMPKILTLAGQEATVFAGETYAMEGETAPSIGYDVDRPNWAGDRFRAVASPSADGSTIALDFSFAMRDAPPEGAKPDFAALAASDVRGTAAVTLPKGSALLIVAPARASSAKGCTVVFVDATVLRSEAKATR